MSIAAFTAAFRMNTWNLPFSSQRVASLKCHSDSVATWIFTVTQESQSNKNALSSRQGKLTKVIERRFQECKGTFGDLLFRGRGESWICIALDTRLPWVIMYLLFKLAKYYSVQTKSFILLTLVLKNSSFEGKKHTIVGYYHCRRWKIQ